MMTEFFPLVDIGDMHLKDRKFACFQGVEDRRRGMSEGGRIDYDAGGPLARLVNPVDQLKLGIGLVEFDLQSELSGRVPALGLYVGQRLVSVDFGLAFAEQVQVGAVQNIDDRVHVVGVRILLRGSIRLGRRALFKPVLSRRASNVERIQKFRSSEYGKQKAEDRRQKTEVRRRDSGTPMPELQTPNRSPFAVGRRSSRFEFLTS